MANKYGIRSHTTVLNWVDHGAALGLVTREAVVDIHKVVKRCNRITRQDTQAYVKTRNIYKTSFYILP